MTKKNKAVTCAAIDMGSNSTEILVAHCAPDHLDVVKDESTMTRLGDSVKGTGEIAPDKLYASSENLRSEPLPLAAWHQASKMSCKGDSAHSVWKHLG